jgi:hypothetical protein
VEEYLKIAEVAARLKITPKTIKNKMAAGIFRRGVHYFSPPGIGPRFKWSAVVAWLEESGETARSQTDSSLMPREFRPHKAKGLDIGSELLINGQYVR